MGRLHIHSSSVLQEKNKIPFFNKTFQCLKMFQGFYPFYGEEKPLIKM